MKVTHDETLVVKEYMRRSSRFQQIAERSALTLSNAQRKPRPVVPAESYAESQAELSGQHQVLCSYEVSPRVSAGNRPQVLVVRGRKNAFSSLTTPSDKSRRTIRYIRASEGY